MCELKYHESQFIEPPTTLLHVFTKHVNVKYDVWSPFYSMQPLTLQMVCLSF